MMLQATSTPLLLLVIVLCCTTAQTRNLLSNNNNNTESKTLVTSSGDDLGVAKKTLQAVKQNLLDLEPTSTVAVRQSSSVVQDWSLVCKELCGAGRDGGAACADVCRGVDRTLPRPHNITNKALLLKANKTLICEDLCRLRLGHAACKCATRARHVPSVTERNEICQSFCEHNGLTLSGCTSCKLAAESVNNNNNNNINKNDNDEDNGEDILGKSNATAVLGTTTTPTTPTTTDSAVEAVKKTEKKKQSQVTAHGTMTSTNTVDNNVAVDVAVRVIGIKPATNTETTTPDWDEMCKILCRTGDGGSLCNCDLSPFLIN